jgi:GTP-binding protein
MKRLNARHVAAAAAPGQIPPAKKPEVALCGRSNVGKSSLINALCGQQELARVSKTPGRTRMLHFFETTAPFTLVDLPGYGFAKGPASDKKQWQNLMEAYFRNRPELCLVVSLIDSRHPATRDDLAMHSFLRDCDVRFEPVATKIDKLKMGERAKNLESLRLQFGLTYKPIAFSSVNGEGRERLLHFMSDCAQGYEGNPKP